MIQRLVSPSLLLLSLELSDTTAMYKREAAGLPVDAKVFCEASQAFDLLLDVLPPEFSE